MVALKQLRRIVAIEDGSEPPLAVSLLREDPGDVLGLMEAPPGTASGTLAKALPRVIVNDASPGAALPTPVEAASEDATASASWTGRVCIQSLSG
jgi:hypothetical protein